MYAKTAQDVLIIIQYAVHEHQRPDSSMSEET